MSVEAPQQETRSNEVIFIDTETTGFGKACCLYQVSATNAEGAHYNCNVRPHKEAVWEAKARDMAVANSGYNDGEWLEQSTDYDIAAAQFLRWVNQISGTESTVLFVSYNMGFDRRFLLAWLSAVVDTPATWRFCCALQLTKLLWASRVKKFGLQAVRTPCHFSLFTLWYRSQQKPVSLSKLALHIKQQATTMWLLLHYVFFPEETAAKAPITAKHVKERILQFYVTSPKMDSLPDSLKGTFPDNVLS